MWNNHRRAALRKLFSIGRLILIERKRKRNENAGPPDHGQLGDSGGACTRDNKMRIRDFLRQIGKERSDLRLDLKTLTSAAHPRLILAARLLHENDAAAQLRRQKLKRCWHNVGHDARALRAPRDEKAQASVAKIRIWRAACLDHAWANRIANMHADCAHVFTNAFQHRKSGRHAIDAPRKKAVCPPHHRVLLVQDRRCAQERCGQQRGYGWITAKADHARGLYRP